MQTLEEMQQLFSCGSRARLLLVGCGWYGSGLLERLRLIPALSVVGIIEQYPDRAARALEGLGVHRDKIVFFEKGITQNSFHTLAGQLFIAGSIRDIPDSIDFDLVFEATGCVEAGCEAALWAIERSLPFVTVNAEMDATIGWILSKLAAEHKTTYSLESGDQPGVLARLIVEVSKFGFLPRVVGNCKGFLDTSMTPDRASPPYPGQTDNTKLCSFADGSKQSFELASLGNGMGFSVIKRGMLGPKTDKQNLINSFIEQIDLKATKASYVDYVLGITGINQGGGVFVVAELIEDSARIRRDLTYMKMGDGPYYLFFCDCHLNYLQTPISIEAALQGRVTLSARTRSLEVVAMAKRDIKVGQMLDGIGGFDCYGLIERAEIFAQERYLPLGLAKFARARVGIKANAPIYQDMVEMTSSPIVELRRKMDSMSYCGS